MILDKNTFGDSPVEINLASILTDLREPKVTAHVSRILNRVSVVIKTVAPNPETEGIGAFIYPLLKEHYDKQIDNSAILRNHLVVKTHLKNCVTKRLRSLLKKK